jgi:hypothetical protein
VRDSTRPIGKVATAFDGLALRLEVVEEVRVVVLDLDDELALLHALAFDDVEVLHPPGDLRLDVDAAVERIEGDHAPRTGHKLPPRQPQDADDEGDEAEQQQTAEERVNFALPARLSAGSGGAEKVEDVAHERDCRR